MDEKLKVNVNSYHVHDAELRMKIVSNTFEAKTQNQMTDLIFSKVVYMTYWLTNVFHKMATLELNVLAQKQILERMLVWISLNTFYGMRREKEINHCHRIMLNWRMNDLKALLWQNVWFASLWFKVYLCNEIERRLNYFGVNSIGVLELTLWRNGEQCTNLIYMR